MTARARVEFDPMRMGVRIAISPRRHELMVWPDWPTIRRDAENVSPGPGEDEWLRLDEDVARALYEALTDHFGHSGHDARALRKDYEAERLRVDKFIDSLTKGQP